MIRVVHSNPVWLAQTQTWIHTQVTRLPADRIESHVVCERTENLEQFAVPNLHAFGSAGMFERFWDRTLRKLRFRRHLGFLARVASGCEAHIVHSHFGDVAWTNLGAVHSAGCRHVVTFYGYDMSSLPKLEMWRRRYAELFGSVDLVLCEGPHMARSIVAIGCPETKVRVQRLGISVEDFAFVPRRWRKGEPLKVLIAATFTEKKGIPYALKALGRLKSDVPFVVTIIGDARKENAESVRQLREIRAAIEDQRMGDRVRMLGYQPHSTLMREAYGHHVFLSPSVTASDGASEGGLPVTTVEMLASGMLVISTWHCDIPQAIRHGETGLLAHERDVEGLANRLHEAIREPERWLPMMAAGRKLVEAEFNAAVQGERLAVHYHSLI